MRILIAAVALSLTGCGTTSEDWQQIADGFAAGYNSGYVRPQPHTVQDYTKLTCMTYVSTGKRYLVETRTASGSDLNQATNTYNYQPYDKYVIRFWGPDQASIIKMDSPYFSEPSAYALSGVDQNGRKWTIQQGSPHC